MRSLTLGLLLVTLGGGCIHSRGPAPIIIVHDHPRMYSVAECQQSAAVAAQSQSLTPDQVARRHHCQADDFSDGIIALAGLAAFLSAVGSLAAAFR